MENIYIRIRQKTDTTYIAFTQSETGTLDFAGKVKNPDVSGYESFSGSRFFAPSNYTYLHPSLRADIEVFFGESFDLQNADMFAFLSHAGALLLAVEENDGLLVAEILNRRPGIFFKYLPLTLYIVKPVAPLALFAWLHGRFSSPEDFLDMYKSGVYSPRNATATEMLFAAAAESLSPEPGKETAEEMFVRYLRAHRGSSFTIGTVGGSFHAWSGDVEIVDESLREIVGKDLLEGKFLAKEKKAEFLSQLAVSVQAEPYNPHDPNAIGVSIENIYGKLYGNGGMSKAGYLRATGAAILRRAFPKKISYKASLVRVGEGFGGGRGEEVVLRISV